VTNSITVIVTNINTVCQGIHTTTCITVLWQTSIQYFTAYNWQNECNGDCTQ